MIETMRTYVAPIFEPATSIVAVASSEAKAASIASSLRKVGYEVEERTLASSDSSDDELMSVSDSGSDS